MRQNEIVYYVQTLIPAPLLQRSNKKTKFQYLQKKALNPLYLGVKKEIVAADWKEIQTIFLHHLSGN
jgi:hypothetical protein